MATPPVTLDFRKAIAIVAVSSRRRVGIFAPRCYFLRQ